jgi:hypothetical protein
MGLRYGRYQEQFQGMKKKIMIIKKKAQKIFQQRIVWPPGLRRERDWIIIASRFTQEGSSGGEFGDLSFISSSSNFLDAVGAGNFRSMNPESKGSADILGLFYFYYFSSVA